MQQRAPWRALALGAVFPAVLHLVLTLGYDSSYSHPLYPRADFVYQYEHGIYRYRVVGREIVLLVGRVLRHFDLALYTRATDLGHGRPPEDLFTALVVCNGIAFVALAMVLYRATAQRDGWPTSYLVLIVLVAMTGYVVTPYDSLSYFLMALTLAVVLRAKAWSWLLCLPLAALGTATRESFLITAVTGVAAIVGCSGWQGLFRPAAAMWRAAAAVTAGSVGTYVALRIVLADPLESHTFWSPVPRAFNWNMSSIAGALFFGLGAWVLYAVWPSVPPPARKPWRHARLLLWFLSLPYVVVCLAGGVWFEAMRLLMPVLLCEHLLRFGVTAQVSLTEERYEPLAPTWELEKSGSAFTSRPTRPPG